MTTLSSLNTKLKSTKIAAGFESLASDASSIASAVQALNSTSLGNLLNETISGIQSLNTTTSQQAKIAILTDSIPGIKDQIVKDVSDSKSDLEDIIGTTINDGFLDVVVINPTPEGVKAAIKAIATLTDDQLETIIANITPKKYSSQISEISSKEFADFANEFATSLGSFVSSFNNITTNQTGNFIQDMILQVDDTPLSLIENFGVLRQDTADVLLLLQAGETSKAANKVESLTGKPISEVENFLSTVPTSLNEQLDTDSAYKSTTGVYEVSSKNNTWVGADTTDEYFDIIATQEQLLIELIKCPREITEIVFYGHEMTPDQILSAKDIHASYNADGSDGIPFHYVVQPGGNLQRGRPLSVQGSYSTTHDRYSIGIVVPHYQNGDASIHQGKTIRKLFESFYHVWPGGQAFDAQEDLQESNIPVGVSISSYVEAFKKINYGGAGRSISTVQLISAAQGNV